MSREPGREKKEPNDNILEDIMFMIFWKPLVGKCFQCEKEPINWVEMNAVALVRTNSLCKKRWLAIFLWLCLCFYPCPIALWTSLQLGNASTMDWKSLWIFIFLAKNKYAKPQCLAEFYLHFNTIKLQQ